MTEEIKVPIIDYSTDEEKKNWVSLTEFLKDAYISYEYDWGNGHALIISFEHFVEDIDQKTVLNALKQKLGLL